jgi:hypothetical protein
MPATPDPSQLLINCKSAGTVLNSLGITGPALADVGNYKISIEASLNYPDKYAFISPDKIDFTLSIGIDDCVYGNYLG